MTKRPFSSNDAPADGSLKYPWRLDTNDRYREAVALVMSLSTASLLLPVFLARDFLAIDEKTALRAVFTSSVYWSWALFSISIVAGIAFHYFSAKWIRQAWGQEAGFFGSRLSDESVEGVLEWSFWLTVLGFLGGIGLTLTFYWGYAAV